MSAKKTSHMCTLNLTPDLVKRIDAYAADVKLPGGQKLSRTAAIRHLLETALTTLAANG